MCVDELSAGERRLWGSFARGGAVDVRDAPQGAATAVRAEVIAALLAGCRRPRGTGQWLAYALTAAGWILATTVAAGISRALNRP
ncbi:hypothetical protein ACFY93_25530 [Streptomyces sp. NPDC008313]|uniref:hypothetical protein n=1 Tax=Streptomyces sp. NPDC008313 TaxID=3364826 RepID=UPI0036E1EE0D